MSNFVPETKLMSNTMQEGNFEHTLKRAILCLVPKKSEKGCFSILFYLLVVKEDLLAPNCDSLWTYLMK